jgi:hypothetical protein
MTPGFKYYLISFLFSNTAKSPSGNVHNKKRKISASIKEHIQQEPYRFVIGV